MASERERIHSELLALRCRRADSAAWRELIAVWQPRLFYYVRKLVAQESDAWDVLQQTWLGAYQNIRTLVEPKQLAAWLYQIARHKAISLGRVKLPETSETIDEPAGESAVEEFDNAEAVHSALDRLSLAHREALVLHFLSDLSIDEIAGLLDVPAGTVKSRLFHAKRELRRVLEEQEAAT